LFEATSRYYKVDDASLAVSLPDGSTRLISYKRRRSIPDPTTLPPAQHVAVQGERPDLLANRYLGDSTQFWRICDTNRVIRPGELTAEGGRNVAIPVVGP
jgi:hypothetical protein